jgi:hypothetical protein
MTEEFYFWLKIVLIVLPAFLAGCAPTNRERVIWLLVLALTVAGLAMSINVVEGCCYV